jgi:probable HAF family extracellular repeat protein
MQWFRAAAVACLLFAWQSQCAAALYSIVDLTPNTSQNSEATAINNAGHVTGLIGSTEFFYDGVTTSNLATGGPFSGNNAVGNIVLGLSINDADQIAGAALLPANPNFPEPFVYDTNTDQTSYVFPTPSGYGGWTPAFNNNGQVLINEVTGGGAPGKVWLASVTQPTTWTNTGLALGYGLNDLGQVVGNAPDGHGALWAAGTTTDLFPFAPSAINNAGMIAGQYNFNSAAIWDNGSLTMIGTFSNDDPSQSSVAYGVNVHGVAVGTVRSDSRYTYEGFVYANGILHNLDAMIDPVTGWHLYTATAINDAGQIVGLGVTHGVTHAFLLTPFAPGDVTGDGVVNGQDIALVASHWLQTGDGVLGDANNDEVVNGQDIALIASNWLHGSGGGGTAVPEPSAALLTLTGAILLLGSRCCRAS